MSELSTAEVAAQFGVQVSGVEKVGVVTQPDGTIQFTTAETSPVTIQFSSTDTKPIAFTTGEAGDNVVLSSPGLKTFHVRGLNDKVKVEGGTFDGRGGLGDDTIDIVGSDGTIRPGRGRDIINISPDSEVVIEYGRSELIAGQRRRGEGDLGTFGSNFKNPTFGTRQELDRISGFSSDDVLRLSKAILPGAKLRNGKLREIDFDVVEGRGAVNRSSATIVYDSKSGGLFYNPQGEARPVEILRMDAGLDLTRNNIVIF